MDEHLRPCEKCSVGPLWIFHGEGERCPKTLPAAMPPRWIREPLSEFWAVERAKRAGNPD